MPCSLPQVTLLGINSIPGSLRKVFFGPNQDVLSFVQHGDLSTWTDVHSQSCDSSAFGGSFAAMLLLLTASPHPDPHSDRQRSRSSEADPRAGWWSFQRSPAALQSPSSDSDAARWVQQRKPLGQIRHELGLVG